MAGNSDGPVFGIMKGYDDVKEFLENLGIEYRFSCYRQNNPEGCQFLADWFDNIKRDFPTAAKLYKMNCEKHRFGRSCYKYGWYKYHGKGCDQSYKVSAEYMQKACDVGSAMGCLRSGQFLLGTDKTLAKELEPQPEKAIKYLERGCDLKNAESCFTAHTAYLMGRGVPKDERRSEEWARKGCELNDLGSCHNLHLMYRKGVGVEQNDKLANEFFAKAQDIMRQIQGKDSIEMEQGTNWNEGQS